MHNLDRAVLHSIASREAPVGQGAIGLELRSQGFTPSVPTIGRRLQVLEYDGLVRKVGVQGRVLTETGRLALEQLDAEAVFRDSGTELLKTLVRGDKQHLQDLLAARFVLEGETAALAARRATPKTMRRLEALLKEQAESIARGEQGVEWDVAFHHEIAQASGNAVLCSLVVLLRKHHRYNLAVTSMRTAVGSRLVVDHAAIVDAIRAKNPEAARTAMTHHISLLAQDLDRYWNLISRAGKGRGGRGSSHPPGQ
ncbi:MAG: FCD domain-containing protein [Bacillota bacterium]|nr:FCD domain-containing protein [Bacillota bacterium]